MREPTKTSYFGWKQMLASKFAAREKLQVPTKFTIEQIDDLLVNLISRRNVEFCLFLISEPRFPRTFFHFLSLPLLDFLIW